MTTRCRHRVVATGVEPVFVVMSVTCHAERAGARAHAVVSAAPRLVVIAHEDAVRLLDVRGRRVTLGELHANAPALGAVVAAWLDERAAS